MLFKSKKFAVLGLALAAVVASAGISLAYWASSVTGNNSNATGTVAVGVGQPVTTTVVVSNKTGGSATLVPTGRVVEATDVTSVSLPFSVTFVSNTTNAAEGTQGSLAVTVVSITIGGSSDTAYTNYVNVSLPGAATIYADGSAVSAPAVVTLSEPTLADYPFVAGKTIVVTFNFAVTLA